MVTRIYANAVAKYNEGKLLGREKLYRLADAEFADAVKMLCDYGYGGGTADEKSYDIDAFVSRETAALLDYVFSCSPDAHLAEILTNGFLYSNAKAYCKAKFSGKENASAVYAMDDAAMKEGILKGDYTALREPMARALEEIDAKFVGFAPDPKEIDLYLTRAQYADSLASARACRNKSLTAYVRGEIDMNNILSALRAKTLGLGETSAEKLYIEGGKLDIDEILGLYRADDPLALLDRTDYDFMAEDDESLDLAAMEARKEKYLAAIWERESENMQSFSPFVNYFLAQLAEFKTVKMILTCLKCGAREEIGRRLAKGEYA